ncbi:helix-turn-helix transcriptional regulator [Spirosoma sp. BT702]|uniref:Helix-turn-helix transcriptional regulator n=1 Tax=Spirosoma profusum TaxID=2771354 RepID=A0A927GAH8_9BACT|nr:AraC family transcriptional regulator [Spirosoma profusum]MBD2705576.1 helix-turn-helix transcriptional regulator [Spirosoma profusum]
MVNLQPGQYQGAVSGIMSANGLLIGLTDYVRDQSASFMHTHQNAHLSLGLVGQMVVRRKSHAGLKATIEQFSYVHAGEEHQTSLVSRVGKNINLELEPQFFVRYALTEANFSTLTQTPGASLLMLKLFRELHFADRALIDNIHDLILSTLQPQLNAIRKSPPGWVPLVKQLLSDNWDKELSLDQIASTADLHPVTVSKYFRRYFGCNLGEYRRRLKVERALHLMNSTPESLTEIAYTCGFFDQSHFIRAFRETTGYSPKRFSLRMAR